MFVILRGVVVGLVVVVAVVRAAVRRDFVASPPTGGERSEGVLGSGGWDAVEGEGEGRGCLAMMASALEVRKKSVLGDTSSERTGWEWHFAWYQTFQFPPALSCATVAAPFSYPATRVKVCPR